MKKIKLTQNKHAIVDDEDFKELSLRSWYYSKHGYPMTSEWENGKSKKLYMHRIIMSSPSGLDIDHINGDKLDNRRNNLRVCSHAENMRNQKVRSDNISGFKGVGWFRRNNNWRARIRIDGKTIHLGYFNNKNKAADAYNKAAKKYHKQFAMVNKGGENA